MSKKILALPLYGIGDVLMTTPAVRNLKEKTGAEITYLHMFEATRDILLNNPFIDENVHFSFLNAGKIEGLRFLMKFRKKFDCSINFYPSNRRDYNLASFIVGSPLRCGHRYARRNFRELNFLKNSTVAEDGRLHNVEEDLRLLEFLGVRDNKPYPLEVYLTEEEKMFARKWLQERRAAPMMLCGIHPGTSTFKNHGKKRWPEQSFVALIDRLVANLGDVAFLLFGGPEEKTLRESIASRVRHQEKVLAVEGVTVRQAAALMGRCAFFVSNDSGPMHMAAAMRVPTVSIFGPTNPVWVRPWGVRHRVVRSGVPCSPCFTYSPKPMKCRQNGSYVCLSQLEVDQVFHACIELLSELRI